MGTEVVRLLVLVGAGAATLALSPPSQTPREPPAVRRYVADVERLKHHRIPVQRLYQEALDVHDQLLQPRGADKTLLEQLPPPTYRSLKRRLESHGLLVNREETVFVTIDPGFFLALAKRYGTAGDVQFFQLYEQMYPGDGAIWPAYIEQQTDESGCTSFAPHKMIDLYAGWRDYRARFPNSYSKRVGELLHEIESQLSGATCVCEGQPEVAAELRAFLARFPDETISPKLAARLRALDEGHSDIRFHCLSG
jgi:hypothetical protein